MLPALLGLGASLFGNKGLTDWIGITGKDKASDEAYSGILGAANLALTTMLPAFGIGSGGGGTNPLDKMAQVNQASNFTATGAEGAAANRESAEAARRFIGQQTAEGRLAAQRQQALGSQALGGAQQTTDLARSAALMNLGNQNRDLMQQAAAGGASPAALAAIASNTGQSNLQVMNALAQQGAQAQQQAFQTAGQAFGASEQIRNQDLAQQLANFQPFALQKAPGMNLGQLGGYEQTQQQMRAAEDPLALLKMMLGKGAMQAYNRPYENETIAMKEGKTV